MRAERLLRLAIEIKKDDEATSLSSKLLLLKNAIQNQINSPNAATQTQTATARDEVYQAIEKSQFNIVTPSLRRDLIDLGIYEWTGSRLKDGIEVALTSGGIVAADALKEIERIATTVAGDVQSAQQLKDAMDRFTIEPEQLEPGEFEVSITIPRGSFRNEVNSLGKELSSLNYIFSVFSEIATGSRENYKLSSISTTDPTVVLHSIPHVAVVIVVALERIVSLYEKILTIRKIYTDAKIQSIPENVLEGFKDHIEKTIAAGIESHAKEIEEKYLKKIETGRRNELDQELRRALRQIAERLDLGYDFDVRGREPNEKIEPDAKRLEQIKADLKIIDELRPRLQRFESESEPVLRLTSADKNPEKLENE